MKKIFFFGIIAQCIIFIISLIFKNREMINNGNLFLFAGAVLLNLASSKEGKGWEFADKLILKTFIFMIPSFIVLIIYSLLYGFNISYLINSINLSKII